MLNEYQLRLSPDEEVTAVQIPDLRHFAVVIDNRVFAIPTELFQLLFKLAPSPVHDRMNDVNAVYDQEFCRKVKQQLLARLEYLSKPESTLDLAEAFSLDRSTADRILRELHDEGRIECRTIPGDSKRYWSLIKQ